MKPLLVGELNPYGLDPRYALFPKPERSAGGRLCYKILGYRFAAEYLKDFDRVNLCTGKWTVAAARERATELKCAPRPTILLGVKACNAFGVAFHPFRVTNNYLVLPHPSGLNRLWNEPGAFERARQAIADFVGRTES
jgi:hypothetical protein